MRNIAVIGSGTMGNGIAHVFAQNGFDVTLIDISDAALKKGLANIEKNIDRQVKKGLLKELDKPFIMKRIVTTSHINDGINKADLVIEAVTEKAEVKKQIFQRMDEYAPKNAILATNTSSISITDIAAETNRAEKIIGMHFMNPVPVMQLVEVISGYNTSKETTQTIMDLCEKIEKIAVEVSDYPGFISNRILMPMINEAIYALHEGVAGVKEIDTVMKLGMAHPMGPLQLADFIGLDVCLSILKVLNDGFGLPKYAPCPLLINMVNAGHLGKKSGTGFYEYFADSKDLVVSAHFLKK